MFCKDKVIAKINRHKIVSENVVIYTKYSAIYIVNITKTNWDIVLIRKS